MPAGKRGPNLLRLMLTLIAVAMIESPVLADGQPAARPGSPGANLAEPERALFTRKDLVLAAVASGVVLGVASEDLWLRRRLLAPRSSVQRDLARTFQPLGNGVVVLPALVAGYGFARLTGRPELTAAVTRIGISAGVAGACAVALKRVVGRPRPSETPGDSDELFPFSSHESFPSGHTTFAFALATAIDRETESAWVPWVAYPAAALVAWSRVHDDDHWTSDVVAGAALGVWTAGKAEAFMRRRPRATGRIGLRFSTDPPGIALALMPQR